MRKSLILFSLLLLFLAGSFIAISISLDSTKDQVCYGEKSIYGDSSVTEGIKVTNKLQFSQKLFWDTTYEPGKNPDTTTDYRFYTSNQPAEFANQSYLQLDTFWDGYSSSSDRYPKIFEDLADTLSPGEIGRARIYLKDYYEYYPISLNISIDSRYYPGWDALDSEHNEYHDSETIEHQKDFHDFFRIPLLKSHSMDIEVGKGRQGTVDYTSSSTTEEESFSFSSTYSVFTKDAIYFTFSALTTKNNPVDTSLIPGGYGIYRLPYESTDDVYRFTIDTKKLSMVYPLDPKNSISSMLLTKDESKILLFTTDEKNSKSQLIVIDSSTMEHLQTIPVDGIPLEDGTIELLFVTDSFLSEDFVVYSLSSEYIALFLIKEDGTLSLSFLHRDYPDKNYYYYVHSSSSMDWDGERLVIASPDGFCNFSLAVYDKTGLLYYGIYENSLGKGGHSFNQGYIQNQDLKEPFLTVEWTN